ncbi:SDR family oxidoreductase [Pseudoduganella umbonata]|uniref:SDR family NAD(P)-dependent oxidoreductase n=1 Tax=Pseudoduganella umbonata TaxID=864828 RepID=A0A4P8HV05_9BURK|nr:SDR family oxidoreductase [Pseudoduganella umbonata]MBB3223240.1 short-subunit dehydrogenase [Pseudoduganella umbonata]QCP13839.1 SDR family NAD(P)-dependent oxidoreductase [Pseudoduganella umbonata]
MRLKRLSDQVIVITGATSGIGLTTARMAAARGAKVVLAARGEEALEQLEQQLRQRGAEALAVPTDVGKKDEVHALAQAALKRFGRIDTWVNNAGISIFGRAEEVSEEDNHRLFQTNFWGVVNGSLEAVKHLKKDGGALINLGSELSEVSVPLQGMYAASKHAVKGYTDALRMELEHDKVPVSVTLIKPAAIDTMFPVHARNYMKVEPTLPAPVYPPEMVAEAILDAAQHPKRDVFVGEAARANAIGGFTLPSLFDKLGASAMWNQQRTNKPSRLLRNDALHSPDPDQELQQRLGIQTTGDTTYRPRARTPLKLAALLGGGALAAAWLLTRQAAPAEKQQS